MHPEGPNFGWGDGDEGWWISHTPRHNNDKAGRLAAKARLLQCPLRWRAIDPDLWDSWCAGRGGNWLLTTDGSCDPLSASCAGPCGAAACLWGSPASPGGRDRPLAATIQLSSAMSTAALAEAAALVLGLALTKAISTLDLELNACFDACGSEWNFSPPPDEFSFLNFFEA